MLLDLYSLYASEPGPAPPPPTPPDDPSAGWSSVAIGGGRYHKPGPTQTPEEQILIIELEIAA